MDTHKSVMVVLPSDGEERAAREQGLNFTQIKSGRARTYTPEEIEEFSKTYPEATWPYSVWYRERKFNQLLQSSSCVLRGDKE
jgi:hypothetical protein